MKTVLLLIGFIVANIYFAEAQQPNKAARIGLLAAPSPSTRSVRTDAFLQGLRELGYVEGKNIVIERRYTEGKPDRVTKLAAELVGLKVDVIVVPSGITNIQAAMNATKTIPIIMAGLSADPVEAGLIESLARPGGNVTGLTTLSRELGGKRLELLK